MLTITLNAVDDLIPGHQLYSQNCTSPVCPYYSLGYIYIYCILVFWLHIAIESKVFLDVPLLLPGQLGTISPGCKFGKSTELL